MPKSKKKFKDTTVGQLLFGAASVINPTLGNVLRGVTSPKEAIAEITKSDAPAEDKVNLGLKLVATPCIDDKSSMAEVLSNAQDTIEELTATVGALQSELNTRQATGTE